MTAYSFAVAGTPNGIHKQLDATTADTITIDSSAQASRGQIINRSTGYIYAKFDGTTAVSEADGTTVIPPGLVYEWYIGSGAAVPVSVVGDADHYSVQATPAGAW